jgi:small-conductance mechanosensitive channel
MLEYFARHWQSVLISVAILGGAIGLALIVHQVIFLILDRLARERSGTVEASIARHGRRPSFWVLPLLGLLVAVPAAPLPYGVKVPLGHVIGLGLIATMAWVVILTADVVSDVIAARFRVDVQDNLAARKVQTQVQMLRRIFAVVVILLTLAIMLLTIPQVQSIGASLLASAGLAGLVLGVAMKPTLENLVAGVQLALSQPFRIEDAVIVENEWGWIEEITSTYVVVRIWDLRRMVLPLSYFIQKPFQNWTRTTATLLGSVHLFVDYTVPVDELRKELERIVRTTDKWLGNVCVLQVVEATEQSMQLRALADARDAGIAWDLRCYIREHLIKFLQERYPESLPKIRAELHGPAQPATNGDRALPPEKQLPVRAG